MRLALAALLMIAGCTPRYAEAPAATEAPRSAERPDWAPAFAAEGAIGTFVLYHPDTGVTERLDPARAATRFLPASTFKLYNSLVALDAGVVTDVDSVFVWDGTERSVAPWNRDHTLRTGVQFSVVWLFQRVAEQVGRDRYAEALARESYGNDTMGDDVRTFWLDGSLQISADEQVQFADRLRTGQTGFSDRAETLVRQITPVLAERVGASGQPVRLLAKTGWGGGGSYGVTHPDLGWLVGWVERAEADGGDVVFALNLERASGPAGDALDMAPARLRVAEAILTAEGILPPAE